MVADILSLPAQHWHRRNACLDVLCDVQTRRIYLPLIQQAVEKCHFARSPLEERRETYAADRDGVSDPSVDPAGGVEIFSGQTNDELLP